jgi:hypothetical protein
LPTIFFVGVWIYRYLFSEVKEDWPYEKMSLL